MGNVNGQWASEYAQFSLSSAQIMQAAHPFELEKWLLVAAAGSAAPLSQAHHARMQTRLTAAALSAPMLCFSTSTVKSDY